MADRTQGGISTNQQEMANKYDGTGKLQSTKLSAKLVGKTISGYGGLFASPSDGVTDTLVEYKELLMMYSCAMRSIRIKFEILDNEFNGSFRPAWNTI